MPLGRALFPLSVFVVAQACSSQAGVGQAPPPASADPAPSPVVEVTSDPAPPSARGVLIGTVVTHDARVSIFGRGGDLRVSVRKLDGTVVADGVRLDDLRVKDPSVHAIVTGAMAGTRAKPGDYLDATGPTGHDDPDVRPR